VTNIGASFDAIASVSLRAGTDWFGSNLVWQNAAGDFGCRCRGHKMNGLP
jgi:hypothetical protein